MFYPLLTLGAEQLFRVVEAAISLKCTQAPSPTNLKTFHKKIDWLAAQRAISPDQQDKLHEIRKLRNLVSHPVEQNLYSVGMALTVLDLVASIVNELFVPRQD
jgi:hypothetical protein